MSITIVLIRKFHIIFYFMKNVYFQRGLQWGHGLQRNFEKQTTTIEFTTQSLCSSIYNPNNKQKLLNHQWFVEYNPPNN